MRKIIGYILITASIISLAYVLYMNSGYNQIRRTFSPYALLHSSWEKYKERFISENGRVMDLNSNKITTSEGQSYAMLRAVWMDDKPTFDQVWKFTRLNLKREGDNLFGWKWGPKSDGSYGFIASGDENSASDADSDIALALILAEKRWGTRDNYIQQAKPILKDLWRLNTTEVHGKRYLIPGVWARSGNEVVLNPSYFSPYAWRIFAQVDRESDWNSLVGPSYEVLSKMSQENLDKTKSVGLPPDWIALNSETGELKKPTNDKLSSDYSYDAMRIPWRIALDYIWNKDQQAADYLSTFGFLGKEYLEHGKIDGSYTHDGISLKPENPAMYATSLGYFFVKDKTMAKKIYEDKILRTYSNDSNSFDDSLSYYDQNWLWFDLALYNNSILSFSNNS